MRALVVVAGSFAFAGTMLVILVGGWVLLGGAP
jgi:hypothetical protein